MRDIELLTLDFEIEKTYQRNQRAQNQSTSLRDMMADPREEGVDTKALYDYVTPTAMNSISEIRRP